MRFANLFVFIALTTAVTTQPQPRALVLDNVRIIDGTGARADRETAASSSSGDRIAAVGPAAATSAPAGDAETRRSRRPDLIPGLIDLHFHIENDPRLALRQLSHGVTAFRDPGQWNEKFVELRRMIAADGLPGPRIFTDRPAHRRRASGLSGRLRSSRAIPKRRGGTPSATSAQGASALKIYFRLPLASARAVIDVCNARTIPCTAHLEILDARELIAAGLHGVEHITSFGIEPAAPRARREAYRQAVLRNNDARRDGRYRLFARLDLDGPEAQALYAVLRRAASVARPDAGRLRAARGQPADGQPTPETAADAWRPASRR